MPVLQQTETLSELLHRVFGHSTFRAHQQKVCEAAAAGRDVLLVMPTGAGKSLCYQLPALARGGTALVISPLIALMDDQATKLSALDLRVARIHSGLSRDDTRQACRDYLVGGLDFLFIAPERMRVPGFPEMLARRKPALVAIDEAHCISQWGHDFRPDYRTLGQHLPALRPAPIIALTATATPTVQRDIAVQLDLRDAAIFITGFRRENLAVEVIELSKPQRAEFTANLLKDKSARPAIVYAASRKDADEIATKLNRNFPAQAYHAGLGPAVREKVQREFLSGKIDVVVATVAFGMGVDKADVRTVVHIALPGSVEAYYQEIGRAGRDGLLSRTVLLHSFADRRMQEFFLEKNYPAVSDLDRVARILKEEFVPVDGLQRKLSMDSETLDRSIEKLLAQGVAMMDMNGDVRATGETNWKSGYEAQVAARKAQIDRMVAYAEGHQCRMTALVQHFGDITDTRGPCGRCDVCKPQLAAGGADGHPPTAADCENLRVILKAIEGRGLSIGKLFTDLKIQKDNKSSKIDARKDFDALLDGLARAGLLAIANDTFRTPEGKDVTYRKATITHEGRSPDDATLATVWIRGAAGGTQTPAKKKRAVTAIEDRPFTPAEAALEKRLRIWRSDIAKRNKIPVFTLFPDTTLLALVLDPPSTLAQLREIKGMGPIKVDKLGAAILKICRGDSSASQAFEVSESTSLEKRRERKPASSSPAPQEPSQRALYQSGASAKQHTPAASKGAESPTYKPDHRIVSTSAVQQAKRVAPAPVASELTTAQLALEERLKQWRRDEARQVGLPSFFIFSDTVLRNIALAGPVSIDALGGVRGISPDKLNQFGAAVVEIVRG